MSQLVADPGPPFLFQQSNLSGSFTFSLPAPTVPFSQVSTWVGQSIGVTIGRYAGTALYQLSLGSMGNQWPNGGTLTFSGADGTDFTVSNFAKVNIPLTVGIPYTVTPSAGFGPYSLSVTEPPMPVTAQGPRGYPTDGNPPHGSPGWAGTPRGTPQ